MVPLPRSVDTSRSCSRFHQRHDLGVCSGAQVWQAVSLWQLLWYLGALISPFVAILLLPIGDEAWRWMLATGAVPALFILAGRSQIPETPRWLLSQGRVDEAREVLAWAEQPPDLRVTELPTGDLAGPTRFRATGRGFTTSFIRLSAFLAALLTLIMFASIGFSTTMLLLAVVESSVIALGFFLPEVKGQSLEEIESQYEEKEPQYVEERPRSV